MKVAKPIILLLTSVVLTSCSHDTPGAQPKATPEIEGASYTVRAATAAGVTWAAAVAAPYTQATLSTKLMGTVTAVHVREGDMVRAGQTLVTIDARDLNARGTQAEAGISEARAMQREATVNAERMRALFADEAATRAQLDAAETGLARANAAVQSATAARAELSATRGYSVIRAPFAGQITTRLVDTGAFATPGAPLVTIQDARRLRVSANVAPGNLHEMQRGTSVDVIIEDVPARGVVEAVVPANGNLFRINVIVDNPRGEHLAGSVAAIGIPQSERATVYIPLAAIRYAGELTGVYVRTAHGSQLRWIQLGPARNAEVEVLAGLRPGEEIVVPEVPRGAE